MTPEDRLRQAIEARTTRVEPSADALHRIEEKLMAARSNDRRTRVLIVLGSAAVVLAVVLGGLVLADDDGDPVDTVGTTTTEVPETTEATTSTSTTTTLPPVQEVDPAQALWPRADTSQRFDDPASAATSFASDFLGMVDPVVGAFQEGDSRSGEVPVQPRADGPVTTVLVRQLEDDTWFVLGASVEDIRLDAPAAGSQIACPVNLTGEALAFEGTVQVAIRADASAEPIGTGFVMGGGGPSAPFDGDVECDLSGLPEGEQYGAIVLTTEGGEESQVWQATVIRVRLQ